MDEFSNENQGAENTSAENSGIAAETAVSEPEVIDSSDVEIVEAPHMNAVNSSGINYWNDYASANEGVPQGSSVLAAVSLVTGIISLLVGMLCCCCSGFGALGGFFGIAALITGILSRVKKQRGAGMAIAGIITGAIGVLIGVVSLVMIIIALAASDATINDLSSIYSF